MLSTGAVNLLEAVLDLLMNSDSPLSPTPPSFQMRALAAIKQSRKVTGPQKL